jgi:hypothetical protein
MGKLGKDDKADQGLGPDFHRNPFEVPENFFSTLRQDIMAQVNIAEASSSPFSSPEHYQQQLRNDILLRISEEKLKTRVADPGFAVPEGYFENLSSDILLKTRPAPKVVPMRRTAGWINWAVAASITLAVSTFAWFSISQPTSESDTLQANIEAVPTDDIIQYLSYYSETGDLITLSERMPDRSENFSESLSSEEIEAYLENSI